MQLDAAGEARVGVGLGGDEVGTCGDQKDVVEGDAIGDDFGGEVFHVSVLRQGEKGVKPNILSHFRHPRRMEVCA